ncbi:MAG: DUF6326 family protein [Pseudomonadota bacterium]
MTPTDPRIKLSAFWLFLWLNLIFRDIHQMDLASHPEVVRTGDHNGNRITEELMLLGDVLVQIPISMVLVSRLSPRRIGRAVTIIAAILTTGTLLSAALTDMNDTFHLTVQLIAMAAILRTAWVWREHTPVAAAPRHAVL